MEENDPELLKICLKMHGYNFSDHDSDEGKSESDEESRRLKPLPVPFEDFRHKIIRIDNNNKTQESLNNDPSIHSLPDHSHNRTGLSDSRLSLYGKKENCKTQTYLNAYETTVHNNTSAIAVNSISSYFNSLHGIQKLPDNYDISHFQEKNLHHVKNNSGNSETQPSSRKNETTDSTGTSGNDRFSDFNSVHGVSRYVTTSDKAFKNVTSHLTRNKEYNIPQMNTSIKNSSTSTNDLNRPVFNLPYHMNTNVRNFKTTENLNRPGINLPSHTNGNVRNFNSMADSLNRSMFNLPSHMNTNVRNSNTAENLNRPILNVPSHMNTNVVNSNSFTFNLPSHMNENVGNSNNTTENLSRPTAFNLPSHTNANVRNFNTIQNINRPIERSYPEFGNIIPSQQNIVDSVENHSNEDLLPQENTCPCCCIL